MTSQEQRNSLKVEIEKLINDNQFTPFREALETINNLMNAKTGDNYAYPSKLFEDLLNTIKETRKKTISAENPVDIVNEVFSKQINDNNNLRVAGRDFYEAENMIILVMNKALDGVKQESPKIFIAIVLFVMTKVEAQQLKTKEIFEEYQSPEYYSNFLELLDKLKSHNVPDPLNQYGETPQEWKPFVQNDITIGELITNEIGSVTTFQKDLAPRFIDIQQITNEQNEQINRKELRDLRNFGCLVVMDTLSLYHPNIQRAYRRSLLDVFPDIPIVRMIPAFEISKISQHLLRFQEQLSNLEVYKRLHWDRDKRCSEIFRDTEFYQWVQEHAEHIVTYKQKKQESQSIYSHYNK
jgi:hypothetical protein